MKPQTIALASLGVLAVAACGGAVRESRMEEPWITRPKDHLVQDAGVDISVQSAPGSAVGTPKLAGVTRRIDFGVPVSDVRVVGEKFVALVDSGSLANVGDVLIGTPRGASGDKLQVARLMGGARLDAGLGATCVGSVCSGIVLTWLKKYGADDQVHITELSVAGKVVSDQRLTKTPGVKAEPCVAATGRGYLAVWAEAVGGSVTVSVVPLDARLRKMRDTRHVTDYGNVTDLQCHAVSLGMFLSWESDLQAASSGRGVQSEKRGNVTVLDDKGEPMEGAEGIIPPRAAPHCSSTPVGQWCPENTEGNLSAAWLFQPWTTFEGGARLPRSSSEGVPSRGPSQSEGVGFKS